MNVEEFEKRAETIVDDELNNIKTMLKKIPDPNAKDEADRLGLRTIDVDVKNNQLAYNVLRNFVANMILEQVSDKSKKINYEQITTKLPMVEQQRQKSCTRRIYHSLN